MTDFSLKLSAYLDGELSTDEAKMVEQRLASDPAAEKEFEALMAADKLAKQQFDGLLNEPIPLDLAKKIKNAGMRSPEDQKSETPKSEVHKSHTQKEIKQDNQIGRSRWQSIAASFLLFAFGSVAGFVLHEKVRPSPVVIAKAGWLTEIADYHAIYAKQKRHLVEVPGSEVKHIEKWLGKTLATNFSVPDLKDQDLNFEGARLLVIKGKPVAQLIYKEANGAVIALCFKKNTAGKKDEISKSLNFKTNRINKFEFVSWENQNASFTVVGPENHANLKEIAASAATRI